MFVPAAFMTVLLMTIISTICWGSFANTYKFTSNYRFELFYWDYAIGIFGIALILGYTLGSFGTSGQAMVANIHGTTWTNLGYAGAGGFIFNIANVLLIAGIEIVGMAVAFPIAIGIALVEGVVLSYALQPKGSAVLLSLGVALAVLAVVLIGKAYGALPNASGGRPRRAVAICIISGLLMSTFAPLVTKSMTAERPLTPYTVAVAFTLGALVCCCFFNTILMKRPLVGTPLSWADYWEAPARFHVSGLLGGAIWGLGTVFNFVAASLVGVAISYAIGQASPMIAAIWGVFVWREFRGANSRAKSFLAGMFACYLLALICIASAYGAT